MKIFLVHNSYLEPGGEDVVFQRESQLLKSAGHEVLEYRRSNHEIEQYSCVRRLGLLSRTVWARDTSREFRDLLHHDRPDIVHVHNTFLMISPSIYSACCDQNVPVVQTLHNYRLLCPAASFFRGREALRRLRHPGPLAWYSAWLLSGLQDGHGERCNYAGSAPQTQNLGADD